ncbi:MAG: hypothetical protein V2J55_13135 [Candidatus Competibacteraceae bacterium]|jgi:hypothetical protein|nr:hypothetical protein [Candidatus Competibacteraceae bacterium]
MLVIRETQMAAFEQGAIRNFETRLLEHLQEFFPKHCQILGDEQVRKVIRLGLERVEQYELVSERDIHLYVGLMFMLGSFFDVDLQLPWAAKIFADQSMTNPTAPIDRVYETAMRFLNRVAGKDSECLERALNKARELPVTALVRTDNDKQQKVSFGEHLLKMLNSLWPEKYEVLGEETMRRLVQKGYEAGRGYNLQSEQGATVYIALMFMLGSGFDNDPQYPWAKAVLHEASPSDSGNTGELLYEGAKTHLDKWLA